MENKFHCWKVLLKIYCYLNWSNLLITYCVENLSTKPFVYQGPKWVSFIEQKCKKILWHCHFNIIFSRYLKKFRDINISFLVSIMSVFKKLKIQGELKKSFFLYKNTFLDKAKYFRSKFRFGIFLVLFVELCIICKLLDFFN